MILYDASGETRTLTPVRAQALNLLCMPIPPPRRIELPDIDYTFWRYFVKKNGFGENDSFGESVQVAASSSKE